MLPDLDKPSLKEMGITLMGDMIAILRYAKKVVEETTCERFLVDSEDSLPTPKVSAKPVVKKVIKETGNKTVVLTASKIDSTKKIVKPLSTTKKIVTVRKPISVPVTTNAVDQKQISVKRKLVSEEVYQDNDEDNWNVLEKKIKATNGSEDNTVEYTVAAPKATTVRTQILKKSVEQKRTVFDRLGDSSVTSTTNLADTTPTFNITGVSKDVFKRSTNVFKRLGDIDDKKEHAATAGILKNGSNTTSTPGILKNRTSPSVRTSIIMTRRIMPKTTGTMRADHEANKKITLNNSRILKLKKEVVPDVKPRINSITKPAVTSGKLGLYNVI